MVDPVEELLRRAARPTVEALDRLIAKVPRLLKAALAEIRDHFYEPGYNVEDLRAALGSSKWFYARFRAVLGISPWQLVKECRMELAARILLESSTDVKDVALLLGWEEFSTFMRSCRKWCRLTPARLRAGLRKVRGPLGALSEDVFSYRYFLRAVSGELDPAEARRLVRHIEDPFGENPPLPPL